MKNLFLLFSIFILIFSTNINAKSKWTNFRDGLFNSILSDTETSKNSNSIKNENSTEKENIISKYRVYYYGYPNDDNWNNVNTDISMHIFNKKDNWNNFKIDYICGEGYCKPGNGLIFNFIDSLNYCYFELLSGSKDNFKIFKVEDGRKTILFLNSVEYNKESDNGGYRVFSIHYTLTYNNRHFSFFVNNKKVVAYVLNNFDIKSKIGLFGDIGNVKIFFPEDDKRWDNLLKVKNEISDNIQPANLKLKYLEKLSGKIWQRYNLQNSIYIFNIPDEIVDFKLDFKTNGNSPNGLVFNFTDEINYFYTELSPGKDNNFKVYQIKDGISQILYLTNVPNDGGSKYIYKFDSKILSIYIDGKKCYEETFENISDDKKQIGIWGNIDNGTDIKI